jgi:hypothetical protein
MRGRFFLATLVASVSLPGLAMAGGLGPFSILSHLGEGGTPSVAVSQPNAVTPALAKFQASGRVTSTLTTGPCPSGPQSTCSSSCDQLNISGPMTLSPGGKGTLAACITVNLTSTGGSTCLGDMQGNGTITLTNGSKLTFATGGQLCVSDATPPTTPTTEIFVETGTYMFEPGTGTQANAVGNGQIASQLTADLTGSPTSFTSTGPLTMVGTYAKQ